MDTYKKRLIYTLIVSIIVVFSSTYAVLMTLERTDYRNYLQAQYSKNMYGLIDNVENIQDNLSKTEVATTKEQNILIFEDIFRYSSAANDALNSLPISPKVSQNVGKFINQVGDYCYTLIRNSENGKELSDSDYKTLDRLEQESDKLKASLNDIVGDINQGRVKWGEIREKINGLVGDGKQNVLSTRFTNVEKQVLEYPALIYDGPFSDNILEIKPRVNALKEITEKDAEKIIEDLVGKDKISKLKLVNNKEKTTIPAYSFDVYMKGRSEKNKIVYEISKHGGKIIYLLDDRNFSKPSLTGKQGIEKANSFLKRVGYNDMRPSYTLKYEDNMVINYVHYINNVSIYPEQIKLKVALDNGSIVGVESEKYLIAYDKNRKISKPKVSMETARNSLNKRFQVQQTGLAIIPTETNKEMLCYEFYGKNKKNQFIIYVNADTGKSEKILKVLITPNGTLTI